MELLFAGLIKLLGSAGFGTIFGGVIGFFNRKTDLEYRRLEYEDNDKQRQHELALRDKDAEIAKQEWAARTTEAKIEGDAAVEAQAYNALGASYNFAQPQQGTKMAAFSTFVRPFISITYFIVTASGSGWILYYAFMVKNVALTDQQWYDLVMFVVSWVAFMAGTTIGWWYAMRPGSHPPTLSLGK